MFWRDINLLDELKNSRNLKQFTEVVFKMVQNITTVMHKILDYIKHFSLN